MFERGDWSQASPAERKAVLHKLADLMEQHHEELALLETLDTGKPIRHSLRDDIPGAARAIRWYAEAIDKVYGEVATTSVNDLALIVREPVGVIAAIVPWNFPLLLACWKLGPALAAGNSVILKPSEKSPLTAIPRPHWLKSRFARWRAQRCERVRSRSGSGVVAASGC